MFFFQLSFTGKKSYLKSYKVTWGNVDMWPEIYFDLPNSLKRRPRLMVLIYVRDLQVLNKIPIRLSPFLGCLSRAQIIFRSFSSKFHFVFQHENEFWLGQCLCSFDRATSITYFRRKDFLVRIGVYGIQAKKAKIRRSRSMWNLQIGHVFPKIVHIRLFSILLNFFNIQTIFVRKLKSVWTLSTGQIIPN